MPLPEWLTWENDRHARFPQRPDPTSGYVGEPMNKITTPQAYASTAWFIGSPHFGDPDSMTVHAWNAQVKPGDSVWIVGGLLDPQVTGADVSDMLELVAALHGSKYLIAGPADYPFHGHDQGRLMLDRLTQRYHDEGGLTGVVNGRAIAERNAPLRVPLCGGTPFGNPVIVLSALAYADSPDVADVGVGVNYRPRPPARGERAWLLHSESAAPAFDSARRQLNVAYRLRHGLLSGQDVLSIITGRNAATASASGENTLL
jgi:hypothetical protein